MENRRILITDDNPALHEDYKKILLPEVDLAREKIRDLSQALTGEDIDPKKSKNVGYELDFASQGEEALGKVIKAVQEKRPYSLIFMDVRMPPGWDGITTIKKIWEKAPDTEIVICTAYSDYSLEDVISQLGVIHHFLFLKKPFDSVEVQQLALALTTKWNLNQAVKKHTEELEELVILRTRQLDEERARTVNSAKLVALGEMAGGIAHEINNPLAIILSHISLQREMLDEPNFDLDMVKKTAEKVELTTNRIAKIIKGLRAFSRSGDKDPMDGSSVKQLVQETLGICSEKFKINEVKFDFDEAKVAADLMVECRATQIIQVLLNLLNNSYDAIQVLPKKWIKLDVQDRDDNVIFSVTDSGSGVPQSVKAKLFQPFFTTKEVGKGTGLGLSISKGIIEDHKGSLVIDEKCPNTRFVVTLPKRAS